MLSTECLELFGPQLKAVLGGEANQLDTSERHIFRGYENA